MEEKELVIEAAVENLPVVNDFMAEVLAPVDVSTKVQMQIELAVEEIFVNIASYAYGDKIGNATIVGRLSESPLAIEIIFSDEGRPYNPLARDDPDTDAALEERSIGGLGIFLVKKNVDDLAYEYRDGKNILTVRKDLS